MSFLIRAEDADDFAAIDELVGAAFGSAVEPRLVRAIRASSNYRPEHALVAVDDGTVVGHVMLSTIELVDGDVRRDVLSLSPLAVAPDRQRQGVGTELVAAAIAGADAAGEPLVVLEGSPAYYGRLGFEHSVPLGITIELPDWAPPAAAQVHRLAGYDPAVRGHVHYPPAFHEAIEH